MDMNDIKGGFLVLLKRKAVLLVETVLPSKNLFLSLKKMNQFCYNKYPNFLEAKTKESQWVAVPSASHLFMTNAAAQSSDH